MVRHHTVSDGPNAVKCLKLTHEDYKMLFFLVTEEEFTSDDAEALAKVVRVPRLDGADTWIGQLRVDGHRAQHAEVIPV